MKLELDLSEPSTIFVEPGGRRALAARIEEPRVAVITDSHVASHYGDEIAGSLAKAGKSFELYALTPGETSKSLQTFGEVLERMVGDGFDRRSAVLALGGGVVSDLGGYVAASFMRGIAFYICSTSLLGMVDASVGGKTGINLSSGKNLLGAFWQPKLVMLDVQMLRTLPERDFRQGAVELFKHGLLADERILDAIGHPEFRPGGDAAFLDEFIYRSVKVKAEVVLADEKEQGRRAHLNLGHTLAHALEAHSEHRLPHGDAVAYGLLFASKLAALRGWRDLTGKIEALLRWLGPRPLAVGDISELESYLERDKKNRAGTIRWVLLKDIAEPVLVSDITDLELRQAWNYLVEVTG